MWKSYYRPATLREALELLQAHEGRCRVVAGGTDVLVELRRGVRPTEALVDITGLRELRFVRREGDTIRIGALATHNDVLASRECAEGALPLAQACLEVGAPSIRTRATVGGNLVTASPANDTITALLALDAAVTIVGPQGERRVPLAELYTGPRATAMRPGELLAEVEVPALAGGRRGLFLKLGLRQAQAISVVCAALVVDVDPDGLVRDARVALGSVAPTAVRAEAAEAFLRGRALDAAACAEAGRLAAASVRPISDVRASAGYRSAALARLVAAGLGRLAEGREREGWPARPVLLETPAPQAEPQPLAGPVRVTVNGRALELPGAERQTLLDALREGAGLTGAKEGCAEGECGACAVWIDGRAALSCLVPAPQAHGASVTTIEGLAADAQLHPLQQAFVRRGAVQCGFCIPGMLMAGAKLLDELPDPSEDEVRQAISGNLCRCTGYRKIVEAIREAAAGTGGKETGAPAALRSAASERSGLG